MEELCRCMIGPMQLSSTDVLGPKYANPSHGRGLSVGLGDVPWKAPAFRNYPDHSRLMVACEREQPQKPVYSRYRD